MSKTSSPAFRFNKPLYSVKETLEMLCICRAPFYDLVKQGKIKLIKRGRTSLVAADDIANYVTTLRG